ncbi:hypothetical protein GC169_11680 [bacterium]|nr:hypothetical protein [bacterium]
MTHSPLKARLRAWRTLRWLKRGAPRTPAQQAKFDRLTAVELAAVAANPDHHGDARALALNRLKALGGAEDDAELVVPGFLKSRSHDALRKRFFGASRALRKWSGAFTLTGIVLAFAVVAYTEEMKTPALREAVAAGIISQQDLLDRGRRLTEEEYAAAIADGLEFDSPFRSDARLEELLLARIGSATPASRRVREAEAVTAFVIGGFVLSWFAWMAASFFRREPARLLLLRKFNDKGIAKSVERVITSELRPFGHIVTLSDRFIRRSRWAWLGGMIPTNFLHAALIVVWLPLRLILRQFNRARFGPAQVSSARDFINLAKRLRDRIGLNIEVAMTSKEAFIVQTSDAWWKHVVALLMNSSDVVVVDLSNVTSGTEWELERLDRLGLFGRAVLMAREDRVEAALAALNPFPETHGRALHVYDKLGDMHDRNAFRDDMLSAMAACGAPDPSRLDPFGVYPADA